MIKIAGKLLDIRQEINLSDDNLLDPPKFLWETGTKIEKLYESVDVLLDFSERLRTLNQKIDYAENQNEKLLQLRATVSCLSSEYFSKVKHLTRLLTCTAKVSPSGVDHHCPNSNRVCGLVSFNYISTIR